MFRTQIRHAKLEEEQAEEQEEQGRGQKAQISPLVTNWVIFSRPLQCLA